MLMKLTPGVNFTNILMAAFMRADPKDAKKTVGLTALFALLGSTHIKAARIMLMDQGLISPTYLHSAFTPVAPKSVRIQSSCQYLFTLFGSTGPKAASRSLLTLTPGLNFIDILCTAFTLADPESVKKY